jgi:hypothetical protein
MYICSPVRLIFKNERIVKIHQVVVKLCKQNRFDERDAPVDNDTQAGQEVRRIYSSSGGENPRQRDHIYM